MTQVSILLFSNQEKFGDFYLLSENIGNFVIKDTNILFSEDD